MGTIIKVSGIADASIGKVDTIAKAGIAKLNGQDFAGGDVILTNLIQHWDFNNASFYSGSGTSITDLSDSSKTGSLVNGTTFDSAAPKNATFDGVNDYMECDIVNTYGSTQTVEFWAKFPDFSNIKRFMFVRNYKSNCSTTNGGYAFQFDAVNKQIMYTPMGVALYRSSTISASMSTDTWYQFAISMNGTSLRYFLNGSLINSRSISSTRHQPCQTNLHCRVSTLTRNTGTVNTSFCTTGSIGELRIYTSNLSDADITSNFDARKSRYGY